jgi:hypothetical protein
MAEKHGIKRTVETETVSVMISPKFQGNMLLDKGKKSLKF